MEKNELSIKKKNDMKEFVTNNLTIALNVLYFLKEEIYPAYVWEQLKS